MIKKINIKEVLHKYLLFPILFSIVGGFVHGVLLCDSCWDDLDLMWRRFFSQGIYWGVFTYGSQAAIRVADRFSSWLEEPLKRFLLGLSFMIIFTVFGTLLAYPVINYLVNKQNLIDSIVNFDPWYFLGPILVTFGVNAFMHSREFLLAWRQNAINYEKLKTEQVATQYDSLKNQVNPHFLFNSLNALTSLVYDDQEKAVEFIRKLSQVYRYVLDTKDNEVVEVSEELTFLESYMYLQKIRFDENLIFEVTLSKNTLNAYILPISLQMLLENAIKHNIISNSKPLTIKLYEEDNYLVVENKLQEKIHKDSTGIGLSNIKARYQYMTDKEVIIEKTNAWFKVSVPLIKSF